MFPKTCLRQALWSWNSYSKFDKRSLTVTAQLVFPSRAREQAICDEENLT
jgi:hypothetical protein